MHYYNYGLGQYFILCDYIYIYEQPDFKMKCVSNQEQHLWEQWFAWKEAEWE